MSKYIDAEKLIAEINNRIMSVNLEELGNFGCHRVFAYNDVKDLIASLQQEQVSTEREIAEAHRYAKMIREKDNASIQQEQPEVDLEKEISKWLEEGEITDTRFDDYDDSDIERTARHFYELGLNARKGE